MDLGGEAMQGGEGGCLFWFCLCSVALFLIVFENEIELTGLRRCVTTGLISKDCCLVGSGLTERLA